MSCTEIYSVDKNGEIDQYAEIRNSWRGSMAIWRILEDRYLPPYRPSFIPSYMSIEAFEAQHGYKPSRCSSFFDDSAMKEIWSLFSSDAVSTTDKIVLGSTFDNVLVRRENFDTLISAFKEFEGETSLTEQAKVIEEMMNDSDIAAVGWNQTSVNADPWMEYDEKLDDYLRYNINTGDKHWWLFEDLNKS
jgi:hypothetical protein